MYRPSTPLVVYLVRTGALSSEALLRALELQHRKRQPFGAMALRARKLSVKQTATILEFQLSRPELRFGEIAVKLGYLTSDDVQEILDRQTKADVSLEAILVEQGMLSAGELASWKRRHTCAPEVAKERSA